MIRAASIAMVAALSSERAGDIATSKGKVVALENRLIGC